jgi:oligoribonuclease
MVDTVLPGAGSHRKTTHWVWLDLEMTGLDLKKDVILEIATIVTDQDLTILAQGPNLAIYQPEPVLAGMGAWCQHQHRRSGLVERVQNSTVTTAMAEMQTLAFLKEWVPEHVSPLCGNSICTDRRFLAEQMPTLEAFFHYRLIDVSTIKELARRWRPDVEEASKHSAHLALDDIKESIEELKYYRSWFLNMQPPFDHKIP